MKVVLLKDVPKVGKKHEVVTVADGFAYNSLIPRGLAHPATKENIAHAEANVASKKAHAESQADAFRTLLKEVAERPLTLRAGANDKGHLFRGIKADDIARTVSAAYGVALTEKEIVLPTPLKEVGTHTVTVRHAGREGTIQVVISSS